ncbi:MAG: hypothetical protein IT235_07175 [Bacteroidia bacterium]|nr:hypothetical protein [Bacteroidia bacterium]
MNITPYFSNLEYITATANQIKKDFDQFGFEIKFSGNATNAYNELLFQLSPLIARLMENDYKKLLNLLYRIDIHEGKLVNVLEQNADQSPAETIADLIIKRELQKVVIRRHYSTEDN